MPKSKKEEEFAVKDFKKRNGGLNNVSRHSSFGKILNEIFLSLIILILVLIIVFFVFFFISNEDSSKNSVPVCGDGTFYGTCSLSKPYFCYNGVLVEKSSLCGCPEGFFKESDFCVSRDYVGYRDLKFRYVLRGQEDEITFRVYEGVLEKISSYPKFLSYEEGEIFLRSDFKLKKLENSLQRQAILPLVIRIQNLAPKSKVDQARIAISLVQNIPYNESQNYFSVGGTKIAISKFPYQVLFEQSASCEGKSELLALILKEIGYGVSLFYYSQESHEAVGIKCPVDQSLEGSGYCFIETTAPSILTDNRGKYYDAGVLSSFPEVIIISRGFSLPDNLYEYDDADFFRKYSDKGEISFFNVDRWDEIKIKYGLKNGN